MTINASKAPSRSDTTPLGVKLFAIEAILGWQRCTLGFVNRIIWRNYPRQLSILATCKVRTRFVREIRQRDVQIAQYYNYEAKNKRKQTKAIREIPNFFQ